MKSLFRFNCNNKVRGNKAATEYITKHEPVNGALVMTA